MFEEHDKMGKSLFKGSFSPIIFLAFPVIEEISGHVQQLEHIIILAIRNTQP
jgi:hypothetical protein